MGLASFNRQRRLQAKKKKKEHIAECSKVPAAIAPVIKIIETTVKKKTKRKPVITVITVDEKES